MRPVLFHWRGRPVSSYAGLLAVGTVAGLAVGNVVARSEGLPSGRVYAAMLALFPVALVGARLAYVLGHPARFPDGGSMFELSSGGQAMLGGLVIVPVSVPVLAALGVSFWPFWDVGTFTILTGMVFARAGCLLTGCCSGRETSGTFGIVLPNRRGERRRRIPMQLLEGATAAALLAVAWALLRADLSPGSVFLVILAAYGVARAFLQGLREPDPNAPRVPVQRLAAASLTAIAVTSASLRGL